MSVTKPMKRPITGPMMHARPRHPNKLRWQGFLASNTDYVSSCGRFEIYRVLWCPEGRIKWSLLDRRTRKIKECRSLFSAKRKARDILAGEWYGEGV